MKQVGTWHEPLATAGKSIDSVASFETLAMKIAYALAFSKPESLQWLTADRDKERGTVKDDADLAVHASNRIGMWQSRSGLEKSVGKRAIEACLAATATICHQPTGLGTLCDRPEKVASTSLEIGQAVVASSMVTDTPYG